MQESVFNGVIESPIYAPQEVPLGCRAQRFFRNSAYYMYCLVPEKPLRLFIPLIFSGGIWSACGGLLSTTRAFPAGTIGESFYEIFNFAICFEPQNIEQGIMNVEVRYSIILMI